MASSKESKLDTLGIPSVFEGLIETMKEALRLDLQESTHFHLARYKPEKDMLVPLYKKGWRVIYPSDLVQFLDFELFDTFRGKYLLRLPSFSLHSTRTSSSRWRVWGNSGTRSPLKPLSLTFSLERLDRHRS